VTGPAGKKKGKNSTGHGNSHLARILGNAAAAAARTDTFPGERDQRIARRRGAKKANPAIGRPIPVIIWHLLSGPEARDTDPGAGFCAARTDPNAAAVTTSASPKPPATPSSPNAPPDPPPQPHRLRCAPPVLPRAQ
jgi:hypothetical protein